MPLAAAVGGAQGAALAVRAVVAQAVLLLALEPLRRLTPAVVVVAAETAARELQPGVLVARA